MDKQQIQHESGLLSRIAAGDEKAMEAVFEAFYQRLYYFAQKLTGNDTEAEDITQETLLNFWLGVKDKGLRPENITGYLFRVVRNRCYTYNTREMMKASKEEDIAGGQPAFELDAERKLMQQDIFEKIFLEFSRLPGQQAEIMKMIFIEGLHTNEIAEKLRITPNNIRNQKARALERLRSILARIANFF